MDLFPYRFRKNQKEIISLITTVLSFQRDLIFESGTGSGKTICALAATLKYSLKNNKKIVYTTRTNAQQRQVILELREIRKKTSNQPDIIFGLGIQGRSNMCLLARNNPELIKGTSEELAKFCTNKKKKNKSTQQGEDKGCIFYKTFLRIRK